MHEPMQGNNWLQGRHALITGGGTGIGASVATHLHAAGAKISVLGRRLEPLRSIASTTRGAAIQCDVTDRHAIIRAFDDARAANGPIAFLVVNAGIGDSAPFGRTTREAWDRIIATNLTSAFDCAHAALADLTSREDGRMVFVASKPRICSAIPAPSRPPRSNNSLSKLLETWMSMLGAAVGVTIPAL